MTTEHDKAMTQLAARDVASEWHSGQTSALYAFSSSGTITSGLASEIARSIEIDVTNLPESEQARELERLQFLQAYVKRNATDAE